MFYHLKIIIRGLRRGGIYSVINISGLAIGMAAAIVILSWIWHQWSFDRFHSKEKNLYAVYSRSTVSDGIQVGEWTPWPLGPILSTGYPEIAQTARISDETFLYAIKDTRLNIRTGCIDPAFLTMFDFPLLQGNKEMNDPYSVILTQKAAIRLFGREDPMGQTLMIDNQYPVTVTGVMKDLPGNTQFQFEALAPVAFLKATGKYHLDQWETDKLLTTYVELYPNARPDVVDKAITGVYNEHTNDMAQTEVFLYPLAKRHLYGKFENGVPEGGLIDTLRLFGVIAGLILLIACINFMNLSTARSEKRAKEVGVRKVMGSKRLSLIGQFLGESMMVAFIAGAGALMLALLILPVFGMVMGQPIKLNMSDSRFWLSVLGFILLTGLLAGSYPAFYLSSFRPVMVLKGLFRSGRGVLSSRKVLVVLQFTIACALIVSTLVIHRQLKYAQDRDSGYDKDQLIYMSLGEDIEKNYELIKNELISSGTALSVTKTLSPMTSGQVTSWYVNWQGKDPNAKPVFDLYFTDSNWAKTVGATIVEGRDIDVSTFPTDSNAMLLNESAVRVMNLENPIGEVVNALRHDWRVVGVVKDFILHSPYEPSVPMIIGGPQGFLEVLHIKLNGANGMADNLAKTEKVFKQFNPNFPFEYNFVDEEYARKFQDEQRLGSLATGFAGLTIFISCMGLFGLVAYMAETRRKEIGIRKVLGASVGNVMFLLSKEFLMLVLISFAIATPVAWWMMNQWLTGYAYRTDIPWWLFVVVGIMSLCIALLTVGFQAVKAATANPVKAIQSE
ncbi:MAG: ABC transporter permease [Tannerella sp.]|jgi:ABC-type antimicrobial peptide transport system permease subunit|nr:ABC transporter permease [Tannerella sp.]